MLLSGISLFGIKRLGRGDGSDTLPLKTATLALSLLGICVTLTALYMKCVQTTLI